MIPNYLSPVWTAFAPALGNHLWQSTLFAITAGLLTLVLRKNRARGRYWLWLAASVKFLIPFSLLVGIGSHLAWSRDSAGTRAGLYFAMEEVSLPFTQPTMSAISRATLATVSASLIHLLPMLLTTVWFCGFVLVLCVWYVRWRRISAAIQGAVPLREGREVGLLRRIERRGGVRKGIEILLSQASVEPGIFGISRPVLVWPYGISERLEDAHLEAILAHELSHVRRRDNLAAAMHMVVEATFWFHPLVWWLGARLLQERERACDEEVLELGSDRQVYAESILKTCEFCVGSPLACVSGVTSADLKKRIVRIMTLRLADKLNFGKIALLAVIGTSAVAGPVVFGLFNSPYARAQSPQNTSAAPMPSFEVASVKLNHSADGPALMRVLPSRFIIIRWTTRALIAFAYGVRETQVFAGPTWINSERYDIEAKIEESRVKEAATLPHPRRGEQNLLMMQKLLEERFKLKVNRETKELPIYALVVGKDGPKFSETKDPLPSPVSDNAQLPIRQQKTTWDDGKLVMMGASVGDLVELLSRHVGREVFDETGLKGTYDFTLQWTTEAQAPVFGDDSGKAPSPDSSEPSIFTTIQEQLGLKLQSQKGPVKVVVVEHIEKPSEN